MFARSGTPGIDLIPVVPSGIAGRTRLRGHEGRL